MGSEQCFCLIIIFLWRLCFSCYSESSDLAGNSLLFSVDSHVHIGMHKPTNIYSVTSVCKVLCCGTDVELIKKTEVALRELTIQEQIQYWCSLRHFSHMQRDYCSNRKEEGHTIEQVKSKQALLLYNSFGFHISSGFPGSCLILYHLQSGKKKLISKLSPTPSWSLLVFGLVPTNLVQVFPFTPGWHALSLLSLESYPDAFLFLDFLLHSFIWHPTRWKETAVPTVSRYHISAIPYSCLWWISSEHLLTARHCARKWGYRDNDNPCSRDFCHR